MSLEPASVPQRSRIGTVELGDFKLVGLLGQGSFAEAYLADQLGTDRQVVVKIAHANLLTRDRGALIRSRFRDEVRACSRVQHPNLATLYTAGDTTDGLPAIAMEFVPGDLLEACLERSAPLRMRELVYVSQLASVLATLHRMGVVHRDVSPRNIMVTRDHEATPKVKLLDFGLAKVEGSLSESMGPMGTPRYAAPEQIHGLASAASDVYSLGAILWWALTGRQFLHEIQDLPSLIEHQLSMTSAPDPRSVNATIAPGFAGLTQQMLSPRAEDRPDAATVVSRWPELIADARRHRKRRGVRSTLAQEEPPRTLRVLVIDPDPVKRRLVQGFAERLGCEVTVTTEPRDATRGILGGHDVAVLGTQLPRVDAALVGRHLREHFPEQRLVLMSSQQDRLIPCADADADMAITVPGELLRLSDYLHALQARSRTNTQNTPLQTLEPHAALSKTIVGSWSHRPDSFREAIEEFIGEMPDLIAHLDVLREGGHSALAREPAALIEARATQLGALHLARLAKSLVMLLDAGELPDPGGFLDELEQEYQRVFMQLMTQLSQLPQP
ncbi:MAG: protein kinase [Sandaracinaceae bacterium]